MAFPTEVNIKITAKLHGVTFRKITIFIIFYYICVTQVEVSKIIDSRCNIRICLIKYFQNKRWKERESYL